MDHKFWWSILSQNFLPKTFKKILSFLKIFMVFRMTNIANLSQSTDGNRLDFLKTCKERQEEQKYAFQSMVDDNKDLKQKLIELDRTLEEKIRQRDAKLEAAQLKM